MAKEEKTKYRYQYDSVARAYEQPVSIPVTSEPKRKTKSVARPKIDIAFGVQVTICGAIVFACAILYVHGYSSLRAKQTQLNNLKAEKIAVSNKISTVQAKMTKKLDLDHIRERAANELGMQKPLPHQIVYIDLPDKSYTTYHE
ncbi:MAG: hypothetical protein U0L26_09630 [Cellulosilyticum sp.]|nr:hypothetical protein [Cellulosilyticum sp.]MEE1072624.1 hypothetical protein [Cellulosilyticum sp.]